MTLANSLMNFSIALLSAVALASQVFKNLVPTESLSPTKDRRDQSFDYYNHRLLALLSLK